MVTSLPSPDRASSNRVSLLRFIADHNPFYLLSAALMLLACLLLGNTLSYSPISADRLLVLIGVLNLYELLLVALGLYLIVKRRLVRDGVMLLIFEAFFVVDVGFLNSEVYQQSQQLGEIVNGVLAILILAKLLLIFRVLGLPIASGRFLVTAVQIVTLLLLPGVLKRLSLHDNGALSPTAMFASWWLIGLLIAVTAMLLRFSSSASATTPGNRVAIGLANVLLLLPLASLIAHLGTTHWVFKVAFHPYDLSPLFLAVAMLIAGVPSSRFAERGPLLGVSALMILIGTLCAIDPDERLLLSVGSFEVSSKVITLAVAYLSAVYCFALPWAAYLIPLGAATAAVYAFGPSRAKVVEAFDALLTRCADISAQLLPQTQRQWGVVAMVGSFVLLIAGAWLSLFRGSPPSEKVSVMASVVPVPPNQEG